MKICRRCGSPNLETSKYCTQCHAELWKASSYAEIYDRKTDKIKENYEDFFRDPTTRRSNRAKKNLAIISAASFIIISTIIMILMAKVTTRAEISGAIIANEVEEQKLKICPDEWIKNSDEEYFIINHEKVITQQFDKKWIKKNCKIKPLIF